MRRNNRCLPSNSSAACACGSASQCVNIGIDICTSHSAFALLPILPSWQHHQVIHRVQPAVDLSAYSLPLAASPAALVSAQTNAPAPLAPEVMMGHPGRQSCGSCAHRPPCALQSPPASACLALPREQLLLCDKMRRCQRNLLRRGAMPASKAHGPSVRLHSRQCKHGSSTLSIARC